MPALVVDRRVRRPNVPPAGVRGRRRRPRRHRDGAALPWSRPTTPCSSRGPSTHSRRERRRVAVRVAGPDGDYSDWSDPLDVEVGLIEPADWSALPITADFPDAAAERPIRFRRRFTVRPGLTRSAVRLGARCLHRRLQRLGARRRGPRSGLDDVPPSPPLHDLDVTEALRHGDNVLGVTVAEGWYRGRLGFRGGRPDTYGSDIGPIAQLELHYDDGSSDTVVTDGSGRRLDERLAASLYDGETYDARLAQPAWTTPDFDDGGWIAVRQLQSVADRMFADRAAGPAHRDVAAGHDRAVAHRRHRRRFRPEPDRPGAHLRARRCRRRDHVAPRRGPRQGRAGDLAAARRRPPTPTCSPEAASRCTSRRSPSTGSAMPASKDRRARRRVDRSRRLPSDMPATRTFECSDEQLNQLHENVRWSMRGNFVDVPTDCPNATNDSAGPATSRCSPRRRRSSTTAAGLLESWLADLAVEQREFGTVPAYVRGSSWSSRQLRPRRGETPPWSCPGCCTSASATSTCSAGTTTACGRGSTRSPRSPATTTCGPRASSSATGSTSAPPGSRRRPDRRHPRRHRLSRPHGAAAGPHGRCARSRRRPSALRRARRRDQGGLQRRVRHRHRSDGQRRPDRLRLGAALRPAHDRHNAVVQPTASPSSFAGMTTASAPASSVHPRLRRPRRRRVRGRRLPPAPAESMPVLALPDHDGSDHRVGALGQPAAGRFDQPHRDDLVQPLCPRRHRRLPPARRRRPGACRARLPQAARPPAPGRRAHRAGATLRTPYGDAAVQWTRPDDQLVVDIVVPIGSTAASSCPAPAPWTSARAGTLRSGTVRPPSIRPDRSASSHCSPNST